MKFIILSLSCILLFSASALKYCLHSLPEHLAVPDTRLSDWKYWKVWDSLPKKPNEHLKVETWKLSERMKVMKLMIEATHLDIWEPHQQGNPFWGIALQLNWQSGSNRIYHPSFEHNLILDADAISPHSWFGAINNYLVMYPLIGAYTAGLFGNENKNNYSIILAPNLNTNKFCFDFNCSHRTDDAEENKKVLQLSAEYFEAVKMQEQYQNISATEKASIIESLQRKFWFFHQATIELAVSRHHQLFERMSHSEKSFGLGWAETTRFLASVAFPTDFNSTSHFQRALPSSILLADDWESSQNLKNVQVRTTILCQMVYWTEMGCGMLARILLSVWQTLVLSCNDGRKVGLRILEFLFQESNLHL